MKQDSEVLLGPLLCDVQYKRTVASSQIEVTKDECFCSPASHKILGDDIFQAEVKQ